LDSTLLITLFALLVHLITSPTATHNGLIVSLGIVLASVGFARRPLLGARESGRHVWAVFAALSAGFWAFNLFRYMGYVTWPLGAVSTAEEHGRLLYSHVVLSLSILAPVLVVTGMVTPYRVRLWRARKQKECFPVSKYLLPASGIACWIWAATAVNSHEIGASGPVLGFLSICLLKAFLTATTEEICYRGLIQPMATARIGAPLAIIFQSCLFTVFHMHLGPAFFSAPVFLTGVMALGIVMGLVTHISGGIAWALTTHAAIDMVIEWLNIS